MLKLSQDWDLVKPQRFCSWTRRGVESCGLSSDQVDCLIRCAPSDGANGFFVALFKLRETDCIVNSRNRLCEGSTLDIKSAGRRDRKRKLSISPWRNLSKRQRY